LERVYCDVPIYLVYSSAAGNLSHGGLRRAPVQLRAMLAANHPRCYIDVNRWETP